ncbi:MAG: NAD(+)/NADH kinase [Filifactoraceae bacterium]
MKRKILITTNPSDRSSISASIMKQELENSGFNVVDVFGEDVELIVAIGGDGAFINALQKFRFPSIPVVGINTGTLGFFQEVNPEQVKAFIDDYMNEDYFMQKLFPLEALVRTKDEEFNLKAINELVIKSDSIRTIHLSLSINESYIECFSGDGLIIATSAGSTAYNYSAGGSILDPSLKALQITPLAPLNTNAYRSFTSSIICASDSTILISPENKFGSSITIAIDGIIHDIVEIESVVITTSKKNVNLIRTSNYQFWNKVKEKFL